MTTPAIAAFNRVREVADALCAYGLALKQHEETNAKWMGESDAIDNAYEACNRAGEFIAGALRDIVFAERNNIAGVTDMLATLPIISIEPAPMQPRTSHVAPGSSVALPEGVTSAGQFDRLKELADKLLIRDEEITNSIATPPPDLQTARQQVALFNEAYQHFRACSWIVNGIFDMPPGADWACFTSARFVSRVFDYLENEMGRLLESFHSSLGAINAGLIEDRITADNLAPHAT